MNQNIGFGATLNGKHTWKNYGLVVSNTDVVGMPKPKTLIVEIPGSSKRLDLTEALTGRCEYEGRTLSFTLGGIGKIESWAGRLRAFLDEIHGKHVKVILDSEPEYYFEGRAEVKNFERTHALGRIELEIECDPYKWELAASDEDWLWDSFNFESGIIRDYRDVSVSYYTGLLVPGSHVPMVPTFHVRNYQETEGRKSYVYSIKLRKSWTLHAGTNRFADLVIPESGDTLRFFGTYTVTVSVRGGSL